MRVKITGFTGMELWYRCKIGETFEVEDSTADGWYRVKDSNKHIKVDDATPIRETGLIGSEGERLAEAIYPYHREANTGPIAYEKHKARVNKDRAAYLAGFDKGREHHDEMLEMLKRINAAAFIGVPSDLQSLITKIESNG